MAHALFVGADGPTLQSLRRTGANVVVVPSPAAAAERCRGAQVDLVVGDVDELRAALDPVGTGGGPRIAAPGTEREMALELALARAEAEARRATRALAVQALEHAAGAEAAEAELVRRLAAAAAYRDDNTEEHNARVGESAARLAAALGEDAGFVAQLRVAATLHDLGKIAIPDSILLKPGPLTPEQHAVVRTHAAIGARVLHGSHRPVIALAGLIARSHHERWDGTGYPDGLAGEEIPLAGRIVAVADAYDVLTHERPWKDRSTPADALAELRRAAGAQFDPRIVEAFAAP